jgi:Tol biopolymer transport system component
MEVWLADPDGANAVQLTSLGAPTTGSARWSPDGQLITFNSNLEGQWEIYVVSATGGRPRRLTSHPANDNVPSFSRDGRWVYFSSNRTGQFEIWKAPTSGGDAVQLSHNVGYVPFESPDGAYVYYTQTVSAASGLWRLPVSGGEAVKVLEGVVFRNFVVLDRGVYHINQVSGEATLEFFDFVSHRSTTLARGLGDIRYGLTATADGRTILHSRVDSTLDDLMLVDNFR